MWSLVLTVAIEKICVRRISSAQIGDYRFVFRPRRPLLNEGCAGGQFDDWIVFGTPKGKAIEFLLFALFDVFVESIRPCGAAAAWFVFSLSSWFLFVYYALSRC